MGSQRASTLSGGGGFGLLGSKRYAQILVWMQFCPPSGRSTKRTAADWRLAPRPLKSSRALLPRLGLAGWAAFAAFFAATGAAFAAPSFVAARTDPVPAITPRTTTTLTKRFIAPLLFPPKAVLAFVS